LRQLNVPLRDRAVQLALTLERLRWLPRRYAAPPLVVNIPEFRLHADDGSHQWKLHMNVVVGRAWHHQTPVFMGELESVIFRPYWQVPQDIAVRELIPALEKDPSYAEREQFEFVDRAGHVVESEIADVLEQVREGTVRIRQRPGDHNALGPVKFVFPNEYSVYLHGTPAQSAFERTRRDLSHGCIRVEDPERLAAWVLHGEPEWTPERIRAAITGSETVRAKLREPIPVLILYATAVVTEHGDVLFFEDIYGQDRALLRALSERDA
jgi:L,D-transpeptidase YcbB